MTIMLFLAILFNQPQGPAARHLKNYLKKKKTLDLVLFLLIEIMFICLQIPMAVVKIAVAPDLVQATANLGASTFDGDKLLVNGVAGLLVVASPFSSLVCFSLDMLDDDESCKKEKRIKALNNFKILRLKLKGARKELTNIKANDLNDMDEQSRRATMCILEAERTKNEIEFRDALEASNLTPDEINDVADEAKAIIFLITTNLTF